ncbi:MAG: tetratricopeptide repeat protein [Acidobacteria bacterium]|nr:tetratricopeptide repeat protein [Acidobacteriota bacterium]
MKQGSAARSSPDLELSAAVKHRRLLRESRRKTIGWRLLTWCGAFLFCLAATAQVKPSQVEPLLREGQDFLDRGDFSAAAKNFESARQSAPENKLAWRGLILAYLQGKKRAEALEVANQASGRWPADGEFRHLLGQSLFQNGKNEQAIEELRRAAKIDAGRYEVHYDLALVYLSTRQYTLAAQTLERALRLKPNEALAHILLGRAYLNTNRTLSAIEQFRTALRLDPGVPLGHYHLGFAYESLGRDNEAMAEFKKELALRQNEPEVHYRLGHILAESGQSQAAVASLREAIRLAPEHAEAHYDLGKALLDLGRTEEAIRMLQRSAALNPDSPSPYYLLGRAFEKLQRKGEAAKAFEQFAALKKKQAATGGMAYRPH